MSSRAGRGPLRMLSPSTANRVRQASPFEQRTDCFPSQNSAAHLEAPEQYQLGRVHVAFSMLRSTALRSANSDFAIAGPALTAATSAR